jgi:DNA-binding NtrC family response regulator
VGAKKESTVPANSAALVPATTPIVVVLEKQPRWAPELQRQFLGEKVRVVACRSVRDVEERLTDVERGVVVLDASAEAADCLQFLKREMSDPNGLSIVIVGTKQLAHLEWSFRELGAVAFFSRKIPGHEMASLCRRQWSTHSASQSEQSTSSRQQRVSSRP